MTEWSRCYQPCRGLGMKGFGTQDRLSAQMESIEPDMSSVGRIITRFPLNLLDLSIKRQFQRSNTRPFTNYPSNSQCTSCLLDPKSRNGKAVCYRVKSRSLSTLHSTDLIIIQDESRYG
jgi:hypothetical protein